MKRELRVQRAATRKRYNLDVTDVIREAGLQRVAARRQILEGETSIAVGRRFAMRFEAIDRYVHARQWPGLNLLYRPRHTSGVGACGSHQACRNHFELQPSTFERPHRPSAKRCA